MKKNDLILVNGSLKRVLQVRDDEKLLVIDTDKIAAPKIISFQSANEVSSETSLEINLNEYDLSPEGLKVMWNRFNVIAPILGCIEKKSDRTAAIRQAAKTSGKTIKTVRVWLYSYLAYQTPEVLAPHTMKDKDLELSTDQKNMRWALNKFYYTEHKNPLTYAYVELLKARYTDENGQLVEEYPTIYQFRYFKDKYNSKQKELITRNGIKDYEMNNRPLLGDSVRDLCKTIGYGMFDATVCDIYLINEAGDVVGRPYMIACVDGYSSLILGYYLTWEAGIYSVKGLMNNVLADKVEFCKKKGIEIKEEDWSNKGVIPRVFITDRGTEYVSKQFENLTEIGVEIINLPSYRAELKGPVEQVFNLAQNLYKDKLKGYGVIQPDFQKRGAKDYRKEAALTLDQFEKIMINCIIFYNTKRIIRNFNYSDEMINKGIKPYANYIWNYEADNNIPLIEITEKELQLLLLPRTVGKFTRKGLLVNGLRYKRDGYTDDYLNSNQCNVAYNPDNVNSVWVIQKGEFVEFKLIGTFYQDKSVDEVLENAEKQKQFIKGFENETTQAKVDLLNSIDKVIASANREHKSIKEISKHREKETIKEHQDFVK